MERLVAGRERIYLDRFWNEFTIHPTDFSEEMREHDATLHASPGGMRATFAQFAAFGRDAADNLGYLEEGKLAIPVLATGGEASIGARLEPLIGLVADHVEGAVVPASAHWLMEENPEATVTLVQHFLS